MSLYQHISDEIFDRYKQRKTDPTETLRVQTHIASCDMCRSKLERTVDKEKAFAAIHQNFAFDDFANEPEHLTYERLEFFIDNKLDEVDREIAESHLAYCAACEKDLADLQMFRKIAAASGETHAAVPETSKRSFWEKIFAFDSIGSFAPAAAVLLIALLFGAWFFLRGSRLSEIAQVNANQTVPPSNLNAANNLPVNSSLPVNSALPVTSPEITPSPIENPLQSEALYVLNDGPIRVDEKGSAQGLENLSPATQNAIKQSVQSGRIIVANNSLGDGGGVLMGEGSTEKGVPFALRSPIGKIIKENQPVLQWKPLKDARSYSVAIVDEKFRVVEESGKLTATNWKPSKPLPGGVNYSWQVTATLTDGTETVSPSSPAPQARFRVIEQNLYEEIKRLETSGTRRSHLALGVLYAKAGLKQEARAEFEKLARENPKSDLARKLLQSVK